MHGIDDLSYNSFYGLSINGLDVLSINVFPCDAFGMHELSVNDMKVLFESLDVTSYSDISGLNRLGLESILNGLNSLNGIGPELDQ